MAEKLEFAGDIEQQAVELFKEPGVLAVYQKWIALLTANKNMLGLSNEEIVAAATQIAWYEAVTLFKTEVRPYAEAIATKMVVISNRDQHFLSYQAKIKTLQNVNN